MYFTADILWNYITELPSEKEHEDPWYVPVPRAPKLEKSTAPESLDCCTRILLLQRIIPKTPLNCIVLYTLRTEPSLVGRRAAPGRPELSGGGGHPRGEGVYG